MATLPRRTLEPFANYIRLRDPAPARFPLNVRDQGSGSRTVRVFMKQAYYIYGRYARQTRQGRNHRSPRIRRCELQCVSFSNIIIYECFNLKKWASRTVKSIRSRSILLALLEKTAAPAYSPRALVRPDCATPPGRDSARPSPPSAAHLETTLTSRESPLQKTNPPVAARHFAAFAPYHNRDKSWHPVPSAQDSRSARTRVYR